MRIVDVKCKINIKERQEEHVFIFHKCGRFGVRAHKRFPGITPGAPLSPPAIAYILFFVGEGVGGSVLAPLLLVQRLQQVLKPLDVADGAA